MDGGGNGKMCCFCIFLNFIRGGLVYCILFGVVLLLVVCFWIMDEGIYGVWY